MEVDGIAVVIDDQINSTEEQDNIIQIVKNLENEGIPLVKYESIPNKNHFSSIKDASFILLDWELIKNPPTTVAANQVKRNIQFLTKVKENLFIPVFLFSHLDSESIIDILEENDLYDKENDLNNFIFVKQKSDLIEENSLSNEIDTWINNHPSVYLLYKWDKGHSKAKNLAFRELFQRSASWPKIIWENYESESIDESSNISELLNRQVQSRMSLFDFEKDIICKSIEDDIPKEDVKKVITNTMYLENIPENDLSPGDIFENDDEYLMNIRPKCDTVIGRKMGDGSDAFDGYIYALRGEEVELKKINVIKKYGVVKEKANEVVLFGFGENEFLRFELKELIKIEYEKIKESRILRLLPPYVTHVQSRYSYYLSRAGFPSLPNILFE